MGMLATLSLGTRLAAFPWRQRMKAFFHTFILLGGVVTSVAGGAFELQRVPSSPPAPNLEFADLDGAPHLLDDYTGSVVLVNFWATWCPPCVAEMPGLQRLQQMLQERSFIVLAVNAGEGVARVRHFSKRLGPGFPILLDRGGDVVRGWGVDLFPTSFLVDAQGRVRYRLRGEIDWESDEVRAVTEGLLEEGVDGPEGVPAATPVNPIVSPAGLAR